MTWHETPDHTGKAPKHRAVSIKKEFDGTLRQPIQKDIDLRKVGIKLKSIMETNRKARIVYDSGYGYDTTITGNVDYINSFEGYASITKSHGSSANISFKDIRSIVILR